MPYMILKPCNTNGTQTGDPIYVWLESILVMKRLGNNKYTELTLTNGTQETVIESPDQIINMPPAPPPNYGGNSPP